MEYINIISKAPVMITPAWTIWISLGIPILIILSTFIYRRTVNNDDKTLRCLLKMGLIAFIFEITSLFIFDTYFQVPTGTYEYQATINKDKITVSQYEEFIEKYNPTIKDGVYYWTD